MGNFELMTLSPTFTRETLERLGARFPEPVPIKPKRAVLSSDTRKARDDYMQSKWKSDNRTSWLAYRAKWMRDYRKRQKLTT